MNYLRSVQFYETGFEDGRRQAQSDRQSRHLMTTLVALFFKSFFLVVLICPAIFSAYIILAAVKQYNAHVTGWTYGWTFIGVVYVLEYFVFFLKGWGIALKKKRVMVWVIPWVICAFYGFALPVYVVHTFGYNFFKPVPGSPTNLLNITTWVVAGLVGIYVYSRFHFKRVSVPLWTAWAYQIGRGL